MSVAEFLAELRPRVAGELRDDLYARTLYSTDASLYQVMPHGVLIPRHADDMQAAVELAAKHNVPLLARAGGSSLAGQTVNTALVLDTSRYLDQIVELNVEERWVRVQPGIVLDTLSAALRPHGLQFGPDPASSNRACLGGIVSNNATGSHSILYGMTADHVLEMECLLDDGSLAHLGPLDGAALAVQAQQANRLGSITGRVAGLLANPQHQAAIRRGTPRHWRRCGGYNLARFVHDGSIDHYLPQDTRFNLAQLVCGAEGTLAAITELKLKLVPRPQRTALVIIEFPTLLSSLEATPPILETQPSAVELVDDLSLRMARVKPEYDRLQRTFLHEDAFCFLAVEYYGETEAELQAKIDGLIAHLRRQGVRTGPMTPLLDPARQANVWELRKVGLGLLMSVRSDWKPIPFIEDTAVPPEHLASYIPRIADFCRDLGTEMTYYAHASSGCLHIRPLINTKLRPEIDKMKVIAEFVAELLGAYGGALSSEHGDGRVRSWLNEAFYGPELYRLFGDVKQIFDPANLFNPGNIVTAPPLDRHLRQGPDYTVVSLQPKLHFAHGIADEIEMCNGAGVCRKLTSGAMCPSFMATRDEEHSTRGRANMLRAAISGRISPAELTSPRMYRVMELCVSCKTCKAECPSSVDMAKLKTEFLGHYYEQHRRPLRDHLFANIDWLSRLSSGWRAPLTNRILSHDLVASLLDRTLGISAARTLPHFARHPFRAAAQANSAPPLSPSPSVSQHTGRAAAGPRSVLYSELARPTVLLFVDTYNAYSYPHVADAACAVLHAAGLRVHVAPLTDCGRPALSKGMIKRARRQAHRVLDALEPQARMGTPIVFLEPSDWSAVIDDYAALLPGDSRLPPVVKHCYTFEQYLVHLYDQGELSLPLQATPRPVLLHGHCHQKALGGTKASLRALALVPGYQVSEIDSTCCGMAGSFGYEAEHLAVSIKMSEHKLAGAVRNAPPDALIVAAGVSCRQQIVHVTGRAALHPAEALRAALC
jgi:FAD/FMN-containing dehydrogenase/Fe-S oxidoreductase